MKNIAKVLAPDPHRVAILDASIYIFRYYFSMPSRWQDEDGFDSSAVYGYLLFLINWRSQLRGANVFACFDESLGSGFRHQLYSEYKSSRALPDEGLARQLDACREVTELLGICSFASEIYEADDLIGSIQAWARGKYPDCQLMIFSRDKDLGQLLKSAADSLCDFGSNGIEQTFDRVTFKQKFAVWPEQLVDYLALVGDSSDDIPGVPGIGPKTASALLNFGEDIEGVFARMNELERLPVRGAKSLATKLEQHSEQISLARSLAEIVTDVELPLEGLTTPSSADIRG